MSDNEIHNETQRRLNTLEAKVDKMMENHLPHIQIELTKISSRVNIIMWLGGTIGSGVILAIIGAIMKMTLK